MPHRNRASSHFEKLQLTSYTEWYDSDTLKYLLHSAPKSQPYFRYVFTHRAGQAFISEWQRLVIVHNQLKQPVWFLALEPGLFTMGHFIAGLFDQGKLLFINLLGISANQDCYQMLARLRLEGGVEQIVISQTRLQQDWIPVPKATLAAHDKALILNAFRDAPGVTSREPTRAYTLFNWPKGLDQWQKLMESLKASQSNFLMRVPSAIDLAQWFFEDNMGTYQGVPDVVIGERNKMQEQIPLATLEAPLQKLLVTLLEEQNGTKQKQQARSYLLHDYVLSCLELNADKTALLIKGDTLTSWEIIRYLHQQLFRYHQEQKTSFGAWMYPALEHNRLMLTSPARNRYGFLAAPTPAQSMEKQSSSFHEEKTENHPAKSTTSIPSQKIKMG